MKKITLLAMASEKERVLVDLRELGVMDVSQRAVSRSADTAKAMDELASAARTAAQLRQRAQERKLSRPAEGTADAAGLLREARELYERRTGIAEQLNSCIARRRELAPWGTIDCAAIARLDESGIAVRLFAGSDRDFKAVSAIEGVSVELISRAGGKYYFAAVCKELPEGGFPAAPLKIAESDDTARLDRRISSLESELAHIDAGLDRLASGCDIAERAVASAADRLEFCEARDAFSDHDAIVAVTGFVPEDSVDRLRDAAARCGWGLVIADPSADDRVPVLLKENALSRIIKPLFDFLGIVPGYHEMDISAAVTVFFAFFYAIIIGDAGYGFVSTVACAIATVALRRKPAARTVLKLFWILSVTTVVWGALCGNYFGVTIGGLKCLTDPAIKDANVQLICFVLAVAQLSLGRVWSAVHSRNLRAAAGNIGWMLIIWGNFFLTVRMIVRPGSFPVAMYWLYGAGIALVLLFGVKWGDVADVFQLPFSVIGSFSDVLSYIRLFAVGMAGTCIAASFNGMGLDVAKASPWFIVVGAAVVLVGHLLNLSMAFLGVMVHAVRLNTLEFSNHTGLTWSGVKYHPFKKNDVDNSK